MSISSLIKVALVWNAPFKLIDITTKFEPYVEGLRAIGIDTITVCPVGTEGGYLYPTIVFKDHHDLACANFWRKLGCSAAAIINWHRMTDILLAMKEGGVQSIAITDSDGQLDIRDYPWANLRFCTLLQPSLRNKLAAAKNWLYRWLFQAGLERLQLLHNVEAAYVTTFAGEGPKELFQKFLLRHGNKALVARIAWLPYPVASEFCTGKITVLRSRRIVAVGRWDSPQKDSYLLKQVISLLATSGAGIEIFIAGKGGEQFTNLAAKFNCVQIVGVKSKKEIRDLMAESRCLIVTSRWEGGPIVAYEMLALGGTVIGAPIPAIRGILSDGRFGKMSQSRRPDAMAKAILAEMDAWENNERDPEAISNYWRSIVSPVEVARRMLYLLGTSGSIGILSGSAPCE
jgi:glycosyltransferase involved in cell wall biosynthesis